MKLRSRLIGILLAGTMVMGMGVTVAASPSEGTEKDPAGVEIVKDLELAYGVTTPNETFTFDFAKVTSDAPDIQDAKIAYTDKDTDEDAQPGELATIRKSTANILEGVQFPHAGVFTYTVTENGTDAEGYGMNYSEAKYTMNVYVKNGTGGKLFVSAVEILKDTNDDGTSADGSKTDDPTPGQGEGAGMLFTNEYTQKGGSGEGGDADALSISKTVSGEYGDQTKDFTFSVTLYKSPTVHDDKEVTYQGRIGSEAPIDFTTNSPVTVQLHHGESLVFDDLPAGTTYTVTEQGTEGYRPYAVVTVDGTAESEINAAEGQNLSTGTKVVGTDTNSAAFRNVYDEGGSITPTGIIIDNLPFILLVVVAASGLSFYVVSRRRFSR